MKDLTIQRTVHIVCHVYEYARGGCIDKKQICLLLAFGRLISFINERLCELRAKM